MLSFVKRCMLQRFSFILVSCYRHKRARWLTLTLRLNSIWSSSWWVNTMQLKKISDNIKNRRILIIIGLGGRGIFIFSEWICCFLRYKLGIWWQILRWQSPYPPSVFDRVLGSVTISNVQERFWINIYLFTKSLYM